MSCFWRKLFLPSLSFRFRCLGTAIRGRVVPNTISMGTPAVEILYPVRNITKGFSRQITSAKKYHPIFCRGIVSRTEPRCSWLGGALSLLARCFLRLIVRFSVSKFGHYHINKSFYSADE